MQENDSKNKRIIKQLTYREIEYLDYLDHHDKTLYGEVLNILKHEQEESVKSDSAKVWLFNIIRMKSLIGYRLSKKKHSTVKC